MTGHPAGVSNKDGPPTVPESRILSAFPSGPDVTLPALCNDLIRHQAELWPQLMKGYAAFRKVVTREIVCDGYTVFVQFNPERITSARAKTDPASTGRRKCFLCVDNLPDAQKGVLYRGEFLILCNPAPILGNHLTIAHIAHIPQAMEGWIRPFLDLAREMSPEFMVFYNGPKCGASAPDHLHFQAATAGALPVEGTAAESSRRELKRSVGLTHLYRLKDFGRETIVIDSGTVEGMEEVISRLLASLRRRLPTSEEPMVNLVCSYRERRWRLIVFPRRKHRPEQYYRQGDEGVLISPAAIDIGGLVVTPLMRDFERVDAAMVQTIFDEVMLDKGTMDLVLSEL